MKIAVTCENGLVFQHFGHTPEFAIYTVENKTIIDEGVISCGETGHGALAGLLSTENVDILICGGIGGGALQALDDAGIKVIGGATGKVKQVAEAYLNGTLAVNSNFRCQHHEHGEHDCSSHHTCGSNCGTKRPPFI